jgi:hypothetical protein
MPTEYVLSATSGDHKNAKPTKVLIAKIIKLEVIGKHIGSLEQCRIKPMEQIFVESTGK